MNIQFVYDIAVDRPLKPGMFIHCARCAREFKDRVPETASESPSTYARLNVAQHKDGGFQIWCVRHSCNVAVITARLAEPNEPVGDRNFSECGCC